MADAWRAAPMETAPTVLILGGFLTSPPLYRPMRRRLLERGAAGVVVASVWTPDWLLAMERGIGPILTRCGRALVRAGELAVRSPHSRGAPVLVIGHSAGGIAARLLTAPEPVAGRRLGAAARIGAIVTLGTPHRVGRAGWAGRRLAEAATDAADRVAPGAFFAPTTGYLTVASRFLVGRRAGDPRERSAWAIYRSLLDDSAAALTASIAGDGLVPVGSAGLEGAEAVVLDGIGHGQAHRAPWYGSDEALDAWWPRAIDVWRAALRARLASAEPSAIDAGESSRVESEVAGWSSGSSSGS